ncbi:MAG: hypothetical protein CSA34_00535 [Desulfobulbus propionicus]|nr:MAG: hypothetical protein CSA34_00535 [Desulfobulbus propionicus]
MVDAQTKGTFWKQKIGLLGVLFGLIAFGTALFHYWAGPFATYPSLEETVAQKAVSIRDRVIVKIKGDKAVNMAPARSYSADDLIDIGTISAGFVAIALAVISFIKREDKRASSCAALLGISTIGFQLINIALGMIFIAIILAAVLGSLGLS